MKKRSQLTMAVTALLLGGLSQAGAGDQIVIDTNKIGLATAAVLHELAGNLNPDGTIIAGSLQNIITNADAAVLNPPTADLLADIATVDGFVLPTVLIPASATTSAIPAKTGVLSTDIATVDGFVLPTVAILSGPTTSPISALTNVLGADVGTANGYLLAQNIVGIAPARTNVIGTNSGLLDGLLLPENPIAGSAGVTGAVAARTGVLGTDINNLKGKLGVGGATTLGEDIGTLLADIASNPLAGTTDTMQEAVNVVDAKLLPAVAIVGSAGVSGAVSARTGVLEDDVNDIKGKLGVGGATSLGEDVGTLLADIASNPLNVASDTMQEAINVVDAKLLPAVTVTPVIVAWANPQIPALAGRDVGITAKTGVVEDDVNTINTLLGGAGTSGERIRAMLNVINQNAAAALEANGVALPNGFVDLTTAINQLF